MADIKVDEDKPEGYLDGRKGFGYLPPLNRLKIPETKTQSARVRWLFQLGYEVKDISRQLNIRYQQVRNMVTTEPKRAAREDLPELKLELLEMEDAVDMLLGSELERTFAEDRKQKKQGYRHPDKEESEEGNEDLDDENYGRM